MAFLFCLQFHFYTIIPAIKTEFISYYGITVYFMICFAMLLKFITTALIWYHGFSNMSIFSGPNLSFQVFVKSPEACLIVLSSVLNNPFNAPGLRVSLVLN